MHSDLLRFHHQRLPILSTLQAGRGERRLAFGVMIALAVLFAASVPFAGRPLAQVWAFIPSYQSALIVIDGVTAVLLFGQFIAARSPGLLVLASSYLFAACMAVAHALSFPGLFAPQGLIGGGAQTTAWLYFLWHALFPVAVLAYVRLESRNLVIGDSAASPGAPILAGIAAAIAAALALTLLATAGHDRMPVIMSGNADLPAKYAVAWGTCFLCVLSVFALWRRRPYTKLDLWLMVVMVAWVFDVALSAVFNSGRFSLGFYAGRAYGILAAGFVFVMLLHEGSRLYARLVRAQERERFVADTALTRQAERLRLLDDIDKATVAEQAPEAIAEAVIQRVRELLGVPRAIVNLFDLESGTVEWLAASGRRRTTGSGVRYSIALMGDVEALKRGEAQKIVTRELPPGPEVEALLASGVDAYSVMPMCAGGELIGALSFGGAHADFSVEQLSIAREIATQLAVSISQARLLARVRGQAEELEKRVAERTEELAIANRDLEGFSYSVSHDLRSPLRAIDGYAQMVEEDYADKLDEEGRRQLSIIRSSARRMGQLIDDLLRFSQLGRKPLAVAPVNMQKLAGEVVEELAAAYPAARVDLGALPAADGDLALLRQVWINLIGNALKYSSRSASPQVEVGGGEEGGERVYWVRDNGAGFEMRFAQKLFKVFQRLHSHDEFEGTGIGLALVHRVITKHGGRIWAEGEVGKGAVFRFALPLRAGQAAPPSAAPPSAAPRAMGQESPPAAEALRPA